MSKKKFDFILSDDKNFKRIIFRFYPRSTHVHGFGDTPPTCWDDVYKAYYSWAIIKQYYNDDSDTIDPSSSERLLYFPCDECSQIPDLSVIIKTIMITGQTWTYPTMGQPAAEWKIEPKKGISNLNNEPYEYYKFEVFNNWTGQGFRFSLNKQKTLEFCKYLGMINNYALEHSQGI